MFREMARRLTSRREIGELKQEIIHLRWMVMEMSTLLAEKLLDSDAVNRLTKEAWVHSRPTPGLTWNAQMTGDEFIAKVRRHAGDDLGRVMEIGPGYGRLLGTMLGEGVRFSHYLGVDISAENVKHLRGTYGGDRIRYEHADFFELEAPAELDCIISSAVFMHFYPSVESALRRCRGLLRAGGRLFFDVPNGGARYVNIASKIYVRDYHPRELAEFAGTAGFTRCKVEPEPGFAPGMPGWFVCATA